MDNECCAKCRYYHRLKHNFKVGVGFEESYCCDVLMHLLEDESEGWVQEVTTQGRCEMYEEKDHIADADKKIEPTPNDCETCIHNKGVLECDMYGCKYEPTTKNDSPKYCDRSICLKNEYNNVGCEDCEVAKNQDSTTKNDLGVDAVSRQAVLDLIADYDLSMGQVVRGIHALPSVTPQEPKTGHWITTRTFMHDGEYYCDKCKCDSPNNEKWNYCPNCGAKMVDSQESED